MPSNGSWNYIAEWSSRKDEQDTIRKIPIHEDAGKLREFWAEAFDMVCYIINRSASIAIEFKTLEEL